MTKVKGAADSFKQTGLSKVPTGIPGFDEIAAGGLPKGRPTLLCGGAGSGKTVFTMEFLVRGALQYNEPGVYMAFEEGVDDLTENFRSMGFDLEALSARKQLVIDHVVLNRGEVRETGEYNLEGLFARIDQAIKSVGGKRIVLDSIEALFSGLSNVALLRSELRRLFDWLRERNLTAVVTAERGSGTLTRHGLEEYVSDCVVLLDHRVSEQVSTRRVRIIKYRGSTHGHNEYPFLLTPKGVSIITVTGLALEYKAPAGRISSGITGLDVMLGGKGYFRGSTILVSGTAGTGKTSFAAAFVTAACRRGERSLYFAFEESASQLNRNMRSVGFDLERWANKGLLLVHAVRPTRYGLEAHLLEMHEVLVEFKPSVVVVDPLTPFGPIGTPLDIQVMLTRLIDFLKSNGITVLFTSLTPGGPPFEGTAAGVSSVVDTWIVQRELEVAGQRSRMLHILKSRGMAHSMRLAKFILSGAGVEVLEEPGSFRKEKAVGSRGRPLRHRSLDEVRET
jgi:circadian clock protein KaiC